MQRIVITGIIVALATACGAVAGLTSDRGPLVPEEHHWTADSWRSTFPDLED